MFERGPIMFVDDPYRTIRNLQKKLALLRVENDELSTRLNTALSGWINAEDRASFRLLQLSLASASKA